MLVINMVGNSSKEAPDSLLFNELSWKIILNKSLEFGRDYISDEKTTSLL